MTEIPETDCDSMCSMSLTVVVMARSLMVVKRFSISSGEVPPYCQMMVTTGMSIFGKISVDMVTMETVPSTRISTAITTKVYGRLRARRTIHMGAQLSGAAMILGAEWVRLPV